MNKGRIARAVCWVLGGTLALYLLQASVPPNILRLPGQTAISSFLPAVMPQGWAFFTKPADSSILTIYDMSSGTPEDITAAANADPRWVFGLNRTSRFQGFEAANSLTGIGEDRWTDCEIGQTSLECAGSLEVMEVGENRLASATVCGPIALVAEGVTPWSYRDLTPNIREPREALLVDIGCRDD